MDAWLMLYLSEKGELEKAFFILQYGPTVFSHFAKTSHRYYSNYIYFSRSTQQNHSLLIVKSREIPFSQIFMDDKFVLFCIMHGCAAL